MHQAFTKFGKLTAKTTGHPVTFIVAISVIIVWALSGPLFGFSDTWQLVINTSTTIITFLMVFLIQNTQNRDSVAMQLKLDELLRAVKGAHVAFLDLEEMSDEELAQIKMQYEDLAKRARDKLGQGKADTDVPRLDPGPHHYDEPEPYIGKRPTKGRARLPDKPQGRNRNPQPPREDGPPPTAPMAAPVRDTADSN